MAGPVSPKRPRVEKLENNTAQDNQSSFSKCQENIHPALSNYLILKEIFKHLSQADLLNCMQVHKAWLNFLESSFYNIKITIDMDKNKSLNLKFHEMLCNGLWKISRPNLEDLTTKLGTLGKQYLFICIELQLTLTTSYSQNLYKNQYLKFLKELGQKVYSIDYRSDLSAYFNFDEYLHHLNFLPNLEIMKLTQLNMKNSDPLNLAWEFPRDFDLPRLWKIYVGKVVDIRYIQHILSICGNVKELWEVPIKTCDLISQFDKVQCVKSIIYSPAPDTSNNREVEEQQVDWFNSRLERFASLPVKLSIAAVPDICRFPVEYGWGPNRRERQNIKKFTHQILASSKETVKLMTIPAAKDGDFYFPMDFQMPAVKILQFEDNSHGWQNESVPWHTKEMLPMDQESEYHYFLRGTNMLRVFPNVEGLEIKFNLLERHLIKFFPSDIFGPQTLGTSIKKLKIHGTSLESFPYLIALFPHLTHLEMESTLVHFNSVFPTISKGWKKLESLTVAIVFNGFSLGSKVLNLDSILTGIPGSVCQELERERKYGSHSSNSATTALERSENSLLNLTHLRKLEFIVMKRLNVPNLITGITVDYALKQLPMLEVSVRMLKGRWGFEELKTALEPVADFIQMDNTYVSPELPFL